MLRADRNAATLAGLFCAAHSLKGKDGNVLKAAEFDIYNRDEMPEPKEPSVEDFMRVLSRKKT